MATYLCLTDFSESSENSIKYASEMAQFFKARVILFHTVLIPTTAMAAAAPAFQHELLTSELNDRLEHVQRLEALKSRLAYDSNYDQVKFETYLKHGLAKDTIPAIIAKEQVDMVVMSNDGGSSLQEILVGTVAAGILENSTCPVLLVPPKASFHPLKKIVLAADLRISPFVGSEQLQELASFFSSELMLLHITKAASSETEEDIKKQLEIFSGFVSHPNISTHAVQNDYIEAGISKFVREKRADMLVIGYHPHDKWLHLLPKNHTEELAYHTYLPLLVLHNLQ